MNVMGQDITKADFGQDKLDPIVLLDRARNLLFDIIDEVWDTVKKLAIEMQIEKKKEEIERLKWNFPLEDDKKAIKKEISANREAIDKLNVARDKVELSFLYIKQGVQNVFNTILLGYGVGAIDSPPASVILRGNGDFVSKSKNNLGSAFQEEKVVISPTMAKKIAIDELELYIKTGLFFGKTMKDLSFLITESVQLGQKEKAEKAMESAVNTKGD